MDKLIKYLTEESTGETIYRNNESPKQIHYIKTERTTEIKKE